MSKDYFADTESISANKTRIWLWDIKEYKEGFTGIHKIGYTMETMIKYLTTIAKNVKKLVKYGKLPTVYFFNQKWDCAFMVDYLLKNGFGYENKETIKNNDGDLEKKWEKGWFNSVISRMGVWYSLKLYIKTYRKIDNDLPPILVIKVIEICDSAHLIKQSVGWWGDKLEMPKGITPTHLDLPIDYKPTDYEIEYIKRDVDIIEKAFVSFRKEGMTKKTQAGCSQSNYKKMLAKDVKGSGKINDKFRSIFPLLNIDFERCYRGGWTFVNPLYKGIEQTKIYWYDVNSMYPDKMYNNKLPYGNPIHYQGYVEPKINRLYIYDVNIHYRYKKHVIPFIRISALDKERNEKNYQKEWNGNIQITTIDLELLKNNAEIIEIEYINTYEFKCSNMYFKKYVEYWWEKKNNCKEIIGNSCAKIMLNALYGKFGTKKINENKEPYLKNNKVSWNTVKSEDKEPVYVPVAAFVTSYARQQMVNTCNSIGWTNVIYGDTDSVFTNVKIIDNVGNELGQWKNETLSGYGIDKVNKGTFFATKRYCIKIGDKDIIKSAGLGKQKISYEDFKYKISNNLPLTSLKSRTVEGGKILLDVEFTPKFGEDMITKEEYESD